MTKYAVIKTGGKQYKVKEGEELLIDKLEDPKKIVNFDEVLLVSDDDKNIQIGTPKVKATISAEVLEKEVKGDKVLTVKYKAKKRFKKTVGFRPRYTKIKITKIS